MWKYYDEGARNMGVEPSYPFHGAKARTLYPTSSPQYVNGDVPEQTFCDWNRSFDQHQKRLISPDIDSSVRPYSSYIECTPQFKQSHPAEMGVARKRLKLGEDMPEVQQNSELPTDHQNSLNSDDGNNAGIPCCLQPASLFDVHLDNETLNNLKKILESSEISAIEEKKTPDSTKQSDESEQPNSQTECNETRAGKISDLQQQFNEDAGKSIADVGKGNISFHNVQLDTATWENLKKITESPVCLKNNESFSENSKNDSSVSQSTKSEILSDSQEDSVLNKPSAASGSADSNSVHDKEEIPDDPWSLNEKDTLNHVSNKTPGSVNRVRKSSLTCHTCGERGHSARYCSKVKKLPVCFICAKEGHSGEYCRDVICSRCLHIGHQSERCHWFDRETSLCFVCKFHGHYTQECSDFWRRYHLTSTPGRIVCPPHHMVTDRIFCYNCAEEGHLGHDCEEERIDSFSFPYYPFIVSYNIPHT